MASYVGSSLVVNWWYTTGTIAMQGDYRTFTYTPSVEYYDETAGADTARQRIKGFKDGQAQFSGLLQAGSALAWGTAFVEGASGTLTWGPEGTAAGKWVGTAGFLSNGIVQNITYNDLTEVNITFQQNGPRTEGTA